MDIEEDVLPRCCEIDFVGLHSETQNQANEEEDKTQHSHNFKEILIVAGESPTDSQIIEIAEL